MATAMKKCRVCGKEYPACRSARRGDGVFRWKEVACSPECGAIYLARVLESRGEAQSQRKEWLDTDVDEYDIIFTEDFDDSDEEIEIEV